MRAMDLGDIDLNDQKPGRFDQDLRFGSESIKSLFFVVKLLEESGYDGPRHFDAHAGLAEKIKNTQFDFGAMLEKKMPYERLDQLVLELLMGVR